MKKRENANDEFSIWFNKSINMLESLIIKPGNSFKFKTRFNAKE